MHHRFLACLNYFLHASPQLKKTPITPTRLTSPVCRPPPDPSPQVLTFTAVVAPNQDLAFMGAIAWTAINLLMSNFMVRYAEINQIWFSQLRWVWKGWGDGGG